MMVIIPGSVQSKERKLSRPYHSPYRVFKMTPVNAEVTLVDQPRDHFISSSQVCHYYNVLEIVLGRDPVGNARKPEPPPPLESEPPRNAPITRSKKQHLEHGTATTGEKYWVRRCELNTVTVYDVISLH